MDEKYLYVFKTQMETRLRALLSDTLINSQELPEMMQGTMILSAAGNFCKNARNNYSQLKMDFLANHQEIGLTFKEYKHIIDEIATKVLKEFVDLPDNPLIDDDIETYLY